jgi:hypothetical protein
MPAPGDCFRRDPPPGLLAEGPREVTGTSSGSDTARSGSSQAGAGTVVAVQRRVSDTGVVMVARQTVALGRTHAGKTVTVDVTDLVVACDDGPHTVRRTNTLPIRNLRANRPRKAGQ